MSLYAVGIKVDKDKSIFEIVDYKYLNKLIDYITLYDLHHTMDYIAIISGHVFTNIGYAYLTYKDGFWPWQTWSKEYYVINIDYNGEKNEIYYKIYEQLMKLKRNKLINSII